ncbi:carbohydrate kinase [bacterium]|nr:carbohydrate kinase [bacterium]
MNQVQCSYSRLEEITHRFSKLHIMVIGDFFLDKYLIIDRKLSEISLETGLEAHQIIETKISPGAAGTVVSNLRALDIRVTPLGIIGTDGHGHELKQALKSIQVNTDLLIEQPDRFTPTYTKPIMREEKGEEHEIERIDIKNRLPLQRDVEERLIKHLKEHIREVDGLIIADQVQEENCGVITDHVRDAIHKLAIAYPDLICIADSRTRIGRFKHVMIKPNVHEALRALQWPKSDQIDIKTIVAAGTELFHKNRKPVFMTAGSQGVLIFTESGHHHIPGIRIEAPLDIVGAGDSAMAGIASALCSGAVPLEAGFVGNLMASITIQQIGTTGTASIEQVMRQFRQVYGPHSS